MKPSSQWGRKPKPRCRKGHAFRVTKDGQRYCRCGRAK